MKSLYLFNPENDMALASGSMYYMPPASAKKMAADLAVLPAWYADAGSDVWLAEERQVGWMKEECRFPLSAGWITEADFSNYTDISAWGWSPALIHRLSERGVGSERLPDGVRMDALRRLSSRRTAVSLLPELRTAGTVGESFWLASLDEVRSFASLYNKVLLKAPWSGSGKGIQPLAGQPEDNLCGWIRRILVSQGGVVGEPCYERAVDFAMEFRAEAGEVLFVGYSLFEADDRGIYKENWLASNEAIEGRLTRYVPREVLMDIRSRLLRELSAWVGDAGYEGYFGVDMMVCRTDESFAVHPCVEVNWRMNMGVVARLFYDRHVDKDSRGRYVIDYYPRPGEAEAFHARMKRECPLVIKDGRIVEGYLSLTPVFGDTSYQIYVLIKTPSHL